MITNMTIKSMKRSTISEYTVGRRFSPISASVADYLVLQLISSYSSPRNCLLLARTIGSLFGMSIP